MSAVHSLKMKPEQEEQHLLRMEKERGALMCLALTYIRDGSTGSYEERIRKASQASGIPSPILHSEHYARMPKMYTVGTGEFVDKAPASDQVRLGQKAKAVAGQESHAQSNPTEFFDTPEDIKF